MDHITALLNEADSSITDFDEVTVRQMASNIKVLVYPVTDNRMETDSMKKFMDSPMWNANLNRRMWELYLRNGDHGMPQYAAPMLAGNFAGLPPAYVEVEEFDCLHDEGIAYAQALSSAGVPVQLVDMKGTFHGFDSFWKADISRTAVKKRIEALRRGFRIPLLAESCQPSPQR